MRHGERNPFIRYLVEQEHGRAPGEQRWRALVRDRAWLLATLLVLPLVWLAPARGLVPARVRHRSR